MTEIIFFLSVGLAHAMTNFDNLAVMLILVPALGAARCVVAYVSTQLVCFAIAGVAGATAISLLGPWVGYVGLVPIGLGLFAFWQQSKGDSGVAKAPPGSMLATLALFLGLGIDTTLVLSAILGDSSDLWDGLVYLGAIASVAVLTTIFLLMANGRIGVGAVERVGRFAPYAMIAVGLYILSNSFTDTI
ncbi:hypothetical protein [Tateyamaria pelophila]|uniref:hypothetical protein n=1 Tax=Tateyamaria pelophila TaxID=328415 RepID=UPI001CBF0FD4|nr:hypothetical protein [Tateyamaria pelophila]